MRITVLLLLLSLNTFVYAQSTVVDSAVLKREYNDVTWQTALNFHYFSAMGHQWYTQAVICTPEYTMLINNAETYRFKLQTGYELNASEHWRVAFGARLNLSKYSNYFFPRITFAHHGKIASLDFIKEFNTEVGFNMEKNNNAYNRTAQLSLLIGLGKEFKIRESKFYTALSFKSYLYLMTKPTATDIYKNRGVDHTQWRFDFLYQISKKIRTGFYATWDCNRYYTLGTTGGTDAFGNPTPRTADARVNQITPIFGLNLFYILKGDKREGYLPIWPSK